MTDNLRDLLREVKEKGLIYWEPNTTRGHERKAEMISRIDLALAAAPQPVPDEFEDCTGYPVEDGLGENDPTPVGREALAEVIEEAMLDPFPDVDKMVGAIADALLARGLRLPGGDATMAACAACEDRPKAPNIPCAVCGKGAVSETMAWAVTTRDGKIDPHMLFDEKPNEEEWRLPPKGKVLRVAIRVVDGSDDAA